MHAVAHISRHGIIRMRFYGYIKFYFWIYIGMITIFSSMSDCSVQLVVKIEKIEKKIYIFGIL